MNSIPRVVLLMAITLLSACGKAPDENQPVVSGDTADSTPAIAAVATEVEARNGSSMLKVNPGQVFACAGRDVTVAKLDWNIDDSSIGDWVEVRVIGPGESEPKVFTRGGRQGSAETGQWVFDQTRFSVVNPATGAELVAYQVTALPCK